MVGLTWQPIGDYEHGQQAQILGRGRKVNTDWVKDGYTLGNHRMPGPLQVIRFVDGDPVLFVTLANFLIWGGAFALPSRADQTANGTLGHLSSYSEFTSQATWTCSSEERHQLMYFFNVPQDASDEWRMLFENLDADMCSDEYLLGRPKELVRKQKLDQMATCSITNDFDAVLSAEAIRERSWAQGNEYFRQGMVGRAQVMYLAALAFAPLPLVMLNLAAVMLKQKMLGVTFPGNYTSGLLHRDETKTKAYYRRAVARRLLSHEGKHLRQALEDITNALILSLADAQIAEEKRRIEGMLTQPLPQLKRMIEQQCYALGTFNIANYATDDDINITARESRVNCTRKYGPDFDHRTTLPPGWKY
ncbi:hypothetical protein GLOTRDRAFT_95785 [Gloeophyllum trabeum ATCC 11539]|uniref:Uncharacterized protein n=1 Tax=Gloeophyllum trabeum (strain ATCC 11539 / FP-39264 / Madison 617) TaxID=670483 RepID=S7PXS7_GLOTA|nr:uncharacterized protein GLOTRDRAFT_95785 [Gloeophyllum trabeum ATCC 11539]EPQ52122.1 hypothetical protein GLOTRDRAFT_95785 [Gloeophyllum trabeum ATCC 11539]